MLGLADVRRSVSRPASRGRRSVGFLGYVEQYAARSSGSSSATCSGGRQHHHRFRPVRRRAADGLLDEVSKLVSWSSARQGSRSAPRGRRGDGRSPARADSACSSQAFTALAAASLYIYTHSKPVHDFIDQHLLPKFHELSDYFTDTVLPILERSAGRRWTASALACRIVGDAINKHKPQLDEIYGTFEQAIVDIIVKKVLPLLGPTLKTRSGRSVDFIAGSSTSSPAS
jgi:hypothetical protein